MMDAQEMRKTYERAREMMAEVHREYKRDTQFANGDQWDGKESARNGQGRTSYAFNRIPALVRPIVNAIKKAPPSISIIPLDGVSDPDRGTALASRIRLLEQESKANRARMHALKCAVTGGIGCWRTIPRKVSGKWQPWTETILHPESVFPDPDCREPDFSDAKRVFHEVKASRKGLVAAFPDSDWAQRNEGAAGDDRIDVVEHWYLNGEGTLCRAFLAGSDLVGTEEFRSDAGPLERLPYVFVTGSWYDDESERWHYDSVVRYAIPDQIAINVSENEWISELARTPLATWLGGADAVEDYEAENADVHRRARHIMKVKDPSKLVPIPKDGSAVSRFGAMTQSHAQSMQEVSGSALNQGPAIDPVSGKSVKLQQAQAAIGTYNYADSLNMAVERDGWIYLDQIRVYEADGEYRTTMSDDGKTVNRVRMVSGADLNGNGIPDDMETINLGQERYGVQVSTGPSYGSQIEQMQDLLAQTMAIPALAPVAPLLMTLIVKGQNTAESATINQALYSLLPQPLQQLLASNGNKDAVLSMQSSQIGELTQQLQQAQQQVAALAQQNQQLQAAQSLRVATAQEDNASRERIAIINAQADLQKAREAREMDEEANRRKLTASVVETYAGEQAKLDPYVFVPPSMPAQGEY